MSSRKPTGLLSRPTHHSLPSSLSSATALHLGTPQEKLEPSLPTCLVRISLETKLRTVTHSPIDAGLVDPSQRAPNLQPTTKYLRLVLIGAFFSTLSQPYLGHLTLLRPYAPTSLRQRLAGLVMTTLLMPPFLVGVIGSWIGQDWKGQGVRVWEWSGHLERWTRSFTGSGYRNDA
jgi:hypothetical protein